MANQSPEQKPTSDFRARLHEVIFEADTWGGKVFDLALIWAILLSLTLVTLESMTSIRDRFGSALFFGEWFFTGLFTVELFLRLIAVKRPLRYLFSFFGMVDLLAVIPTYLSLAIPGAQSLVVVRTFRLLRIFRILKLSTYLEESNALYLALIASRHKIMVFLMAVLSIAVTMGALMYTVEGQEHGFTSIPQGMYWAIVTMTTVGYGDMSPQTDIGRLLASLLMILGYGIIAVPTGIVTQEFVRQAKGGVSRQACPACGLNSHDIDAHFCKKCGSKL